MAELAHTKIKLDITPRTETLLLAIESLRGHHVQLAEAAHAKHDISEANYQCGWTDALDAVQNLVVGEL